jgi:hypothetical protein
LAAQGGAEHLVQFYAVEPRLVDAGYGRVPPERFHKLPRQFGLSVRGVRELGLFNRGPIAGG